MNKISVVGMGYIGLPTAILISSPKNKIICIDNNEEKIQTLSQGNIYLKEQKIINQFKRKKSFLSFFNNIQLSDTYIICVPTPVKKISNSFYKEDLSILNSVLKTLKKKIKKDDLVIIESTCPPGTAAKFYNKVKKKINFHIAVCTERAMPGSTIQEMVFNNRIIGASSKEAFKRAENIYKKFTKGKIYQMSLEEAELIKLFENAYRDTNIALSNEMDTICKKFKVNSKNVIKMANLHPRVNIHNPGIGVGGHCIPVDPWFLIEKKTKNHSMIYNARTLNLKKENEVYKDLIKILDKRKKILFFGVTYKENTDDLRNSSSLKIIKKLFKKIPSAYIFDPINITHNNIDKKDIKKQKFDFLIIFVKHSWLLNNHIKANKKIFLY